MKHTRLMWACVKSFIVSFSIFLSFDVNAVEIKPKLIETIKPAVVSIRLHQTASAYDKACSGSGTGFVADKAKGIIVTNHHIASIDTPSDYEATFYDGSTVELKFLWNDPTNDFAFLKVDPKKIPDGIPQLAFSREAKVGQDVFMIGNNQARSHSVQSGAISDVFAIEDILWPQQTFHISLNSRGGSSGSPVFNERGEVIALNFAGDDTTAFALPISYVLDAMKFLMEEKIPSRYSTGAVFNHINLDHASDYYQYSNKNIRNRLTKIPGSRNRILTVSSILPETPAAKYLEVGDIVEEIDGEFVGPDLYHFEKAVNQASAGYVKLKICRDGKYHEIQVPTIDLNAHTCSKIVLCGNTTFATVGPIMSWRTGMPMKSICVANNQASSFLTDLPQMLDPVPEPQVMFIKMDGKPTRSLDDLIAILPQIMKKQKFSYVIKDFGVTFRNGGRIFRTNQAILTQFAKYKPGLYNAPVVISFNPKEREWVRQEISIPLEKSKSGK